MRRSQRDYRLPVKLAVVGEVGRGSQYASDACQTALSKAQLRCFDDRWLRLLPKRAGRARQRHFERRIPLRAPRRAGLGPLARQPGRAPLQQGTPAPGPELFNS